MGDAYLWVMGLGLVMMAPLMIKVSIDLIRSFRDRNVSRETLDARSWQELQAAAHQWSSETFPKETLITKMAHLSRESVEIAVSRGEDPHEWADAMILLVSAAALAGLGMEPLKAACWEKLEINKRRKWGPPDAEGVCEHVK